MYKKKGKRKGAPEGGQNDGTSGSGQDFIKSTAGGSSSVGHEQSSDTTYDLPEEYEKPWHKKLLNGFGLLITGLLNLSLIMSYLGRLAHHYYDPILAVLGNFAFLLLVDVSMLAPLLLEVSKVEVKGETLVLHTPLFKAAVSAKDVVAYYNPQFLKFACLRTKRCFYLFNRRDLKPFSSLDARIKQMRSFAPVAVDK